MKKLNAGHRTRALSEREAKYRAQRGHVESASKKPAEPKKPKAPKAPSADTTPPPAPTPPGDGAQLTDAELERLTAPGPVGEG